MTEGFGDYLERVRAHRAEMGESLAAVRDALAAGQAPERVAVALTELAHDLRDHVALTEGPGGLYGDLRTRAPRLSRQLDDQLADHARMAGEVDAALARAERGEVEPAPVEAIVAHIERHQHATTALVFEAYEVDLGGMG